MRSDLSRRLASLLWKVSIGETVRAGKSRGEPPAGVGWPVRQFRNENGLGDQLEVRLLGLWEEIKGEENLPAHPGV